MPKYLALAEDISPSVDKNDWWRKHKTELPHWSKACKMVLLVEPSSAAAERVFSLLSNSFTEQQMSLLEDYIMLQYTNFIFDVWNNCRIISFLFFE